MAEPLPPALGLDGDAGEPVAGGRVSHVWRARLDGRPVAVRRSPWFRTVEEVGYELTVLSALHDAGVPSVVAPIGDAVPIGGHVWAMFEWFEGDAPTVPVADPAAYGWLLAELHAGTNRLVDRGQRPRWCRVDQFLTHPRGDGGTSLRDVLDDFERAHGAVGRRLATFVRAVHERLALADCDNLPHTVAHGDFGPHQVLVAADGRSVVVDWDFCHLDLRAADVAIGSSMARPTATRAGSFVTAYGELEPAEIALLPDLRRAFHLNNLANQVAALWMNGIDIDGGLAVISERLEREQWWGPTLLAGAVRGRVEEVPVSPSSSDLEVALAVADRAALVAMHWFEAGCVAETKDDASPVTDGDRAVEGVIRDSLAELRPDDAVLGEEMGLSGESTRTWILDPIDYTSSFVVGEPSWFVNVALRDGDEIVVAVVDAPAQGLRWWAAKGGGTFERRDGDVHGLHVSTRAEVAGALVHHHPPTVGERLPPSVVVPDHRSKLPLVEVVRGELDAFFVECCQVWDHAPWVLLVQEAGGRFTDHRGGASPDERGGLYSNAAVHDALLAAIRR